jgi:membrane fusion protein (multidrug efflux system)
MFVSTLARICRPRTSKILPDGSAPNISGSIPSWTMGIPFTLLLVLVGTICGCSKEEPPAPPPPTEVVAMTVEPHTVPVTVTFVAQVESSHQVEIVARVNGFLDKILYHEGDVVKAGQVLFLMDKKPFKAQVDAARGELENRQAQLWTAKANLARIKPLAEQDAASQSDLDNAIGAVKAGEAAVYQARARLDKAELDLSYTTIASPVTGVTGQALMREGAYLSAVGQASKLTYVARIDPIWINFSVSQNQMAQRRKEYAAGQMIPPPDKQYKVKLELSDGTIYPHAGKLSFVSPTFSQDTGTFLVRAQLVNPDGVLRPGMFVKATVAGDKLPNALTVPQKAVQQTSNGHVVYVVTPEGTAEIRPVIVGEWVGQDWVITQGLKAGEKVVVDGFQRLAPGAPVKIVKPEAASAEASGKPESTIQPAAAAGK